MHLIPCYCHYNNKETDKKWNKNLGGPRPFNNIEHLEFPMFQSKFTMTLLKAKLKLTERNKLTVFKFLLWPEPATGGITFFLI